MPSPFASLASVSAGCRLEEYFSSFVQIIEIQTLQWGNYGESINRDLGVIEGQWEERDGGPAFKNEVESRRFISFRHAATLGGLNTLTLWFTL